jgi:hypothetical protein
MIIFTACIVVGGTNTGARGGGGITVEGFGLDFQRWWWNAEAPVPEGCCENAELEEGTVLAPLGPNRSG